MISDNPILNYSYFEPKLHYAAPLDEANILIFSLNHHLVNRRIIMPDDKRVEFDLNDLPYTIVFNH